MDEIDAFFDACFDQPISKPECSGNPIASNSVCDVDTFFDLSMGTKSNNSIPVAGKSCDKSGTSETKNRNKSSSNSRLFSWRKKKSNSELSSRYLDEGYVAKLVACEFLPEYDNGSKPICNQTCAHNCQQYFRNQIDVLREEMTESMRTARSEGVCCTKTSNEGEM